MSGDIIDRRLRYLAMLRIFGGSITNYCYSHSNSLEDAQDLSQDIMTLLWESLDTLSPDSTPRQQNRWMRRVMRTAFIRHLRLWPHHRSVPLESAADVADEPEVDTELLEDFLARLTPDERSLLEERFQGYTHAEIAARRGLSEATVRQQYSRIIKKLKR